MARARSLSPARSSKADDRKHEPDNGHEAVLDEAAFPNAADDLPGMEVCRSAGRSTMPAQVTTSSGFRLEKKPDNDDGDPDEDEHRTGRSAIGLSCPCLADVLGPSRRFLRAPRPSRPAPTMSVRRPEKAARRNARRIASSQSDGPMIRAPRGAQDVHVVVLHALARGERIVAERRANATNLVSRDTGANAAAAQHDPTCCEAASHRPAHSLGKPG